MCVVYYGIALVLDDLPGKLLVKFFLVQIIEFPALLIYLLMVDVVGRKPLYIMGFVIGNCNHKVYCNQRKCSIRFQQLNVCSNSTSHEKWHIKFLLLDVACTFRRDFMYCN